MLTHGQVALHIAQQHCAGGDVHIVDHNIAINRFGFRSRLRHGRRGQIQRDGSKGHTASFFRRYIQIHVAGGAHAINAACIHSREYSCTVQGTIAAVHHLGNQRNTRIPVDIVRHLCPIHCFSTIISGVYHHRLGITIPVGIVHADYRQGGYIRCQCGYRRCQLAYQHQQSHQPCGRSLEECGGRFVHPVLLLLSPCYWRIESVNRHYRR